MGSVGPSTTCFKTHQPVERRMYALNNNFHLGLEIPMAVTDAPKGNSFVTSIAVGTAVAGGPPHRSGREELPHPAPALNRARNRSLGYE